MSTPSARPDRTPPIVVGEQWYDTTVVISCSGIIDMLTATSLERAITAALDKQPAALIVDLTAVDFLASHGMGVLVGADDRLSADQRFAVVADGPATSRPMTLIGLADQLSMYATLEAALADHTA